MDYDILFVAMDYVNNKLANGPTTIYMKVNGDYVPRQTKGFAYIEDDMVWLNLEPIKDYPNRVRTRLMLWDEPKYDTL